jgi:hypothetical protein
MNRIAISVATIAATLTVGAVPTYAHDCFNPTKDEHAPTAGVHYAFLGIDPETHEPILEKVAQGKGIGGFAEVAPGVYTHTIGNSSSHETVGGPGSEKESHACDGKGIDYLSACGIGG